MVIVKNKDSIQLNKDLIDKSEVIKHQKVN